MPAYTTATITPTHHQALLGWQRLHFPELEFLQEEYVREVRDVIELTNVAIVQTKIRNVSAADARTHVREIQDTGEARLGISVADLLFVPDVKFFRRRGAQEIVFQPYDVYGNLLAGGSEGYLDYLAKVLPDGYRATDEFKQYAEQLIGGQMMQSRYGW